MKKNVNLRNMIFESGKTQRELARETGINQTLISLAIHGRYNLDQEQKVKICRALKKAEESLFPKCTE